MPSDSPLLALPTELRHQIYRLVIQNVHIHLDPETIPSLQTRSGKKSPKPISSRELLSFVRKADKSKIALLYTSKFCSKDAMQILADNTVIGLRGKDNNGENYKILAAVDKIFLKRVAEIHMSPICMLRSNHASLDRLKRVRITAPSRKVYDLFDVSHDLACPRCGDPTGQKRYRRFWATLTNEAQTRIHVQQLAQNKGWDLELALICGFHAPPSSTAAVKMVAEYNLATGKLISENAVCNGEIVATKAELVEWRLSERLLRLMEA